MSFAVTEGGGGSVSAPSVVTDAQGIARTTLTLGTTVGTNRVRCQNTID